MLFSTGPAGCIHVPSLPGGPIMLTSGQIAALGGGVALVLGLAAWPTIAQESKTRARPGTTVSPHVDDPNKVAHPPWVHVPDYFNKVEPPLTPEQRSRIY